MSTNELNFGKKNRAPLPEEIYPSLAKEKPNSVLNESHKTGGTTSAERVPRTLPLGEPVVKRRPEFLTESLPSTRYSWAPDSGIKGLRTERRSSGDINSLSDNEVLDVRRQIENVRGLENTEQHNGHKRHSSADVSKTLHGSSSKGSSHSLNLYDRSFSLNSLSSLYGTADFVDSQMVDQEDIVTLTAHVRHFSEALSKLRNAFPSNGSDTESDECTDSGTAVDEMHVCLGKVLSNLKEVIHRYPSLRSSEILAAAGDLISKVKSLNCVDNKIPDDFYYAIDQLALVFGSSISDLLMGDQEMSPNKVGDDGEDADDFPEDGYDEDGSEGDTLSESMNLPSRQALNDIVRDKDADVYSVLQKMDSGVECCFQWTKQWSRYVSQISNYVEKRAQLEHEFTKQLARLAQSTRNSISEENYLPFQSTFITALDQDVEYSQKCQQTFVSITGPKFTEPLKQRRSVHDHARRDMKDEWGKTCRQLADSAHYLKTMQNAYYKRKQELEKLNTRQGDTRENKEDSFSVFSSNKGKKEEELRSKVEEAEQSYRNAIKTANEMENKAEKIKHRLVAQTKQLVNECDRTFRAVTLNYFTLMNVLAVPTPIHFKTLADSCQGYEPGKEFEDFVRFQQPNAHSAVRINYEFEPYINRSSNDIDSPVKGSLGQTINDEGHASPSRSPSPSPKHGKLESRKHHPHSTDDESDGDIKKPRPSKTGKPSSKSGRPKKPKITKAASTHTFHKIRTPAKCSECESYVFFIGVECALCGLSCHRRCLGKLNKECNHRVPPARVHMKIFGVPFSEDGGVPVLVTKCVKELNRRGLKVKGIYRVSGVKSKMESLCLALETNVDVVDLSTRPPHLIASVLKLYIRQLPEPLMTTRLYSDLIQIAKESANLNFLSIDEYEGASREEFKKLLERLQTTLRKLPRSNYLTTATLIKHLHKVSIHEDENQMSAQNLAIVFGPTILKLESENSTTSLSSLVDMSHQSRIVALLIVNPQVFDDVPDEPEDDEESDDHGERDKKDSSLPNTPVEKFVLPKSEEEENGMPALYGERSTRVRGGGLSPMDQLATTSDVKDNSRTDSGTKRTDERIDIQGKATAVFNGAPISIPGSLEERNKYFIDFTEDDDRLPGPAGHSDDLLSYDVEPKQQHVGQINTSIFARNEADFSNKPNNGDDYSKFAKDASLTDEIQTELDKKLQLTLSVDTTRVNTDTQDFPSPNESNNDSSEDTSLPRRRSKAFSVGKRKGDPDMLAKRGSALMNAYMGENKIDDESSPQGSPSRKLLNHSTFSTNDSKQDDINDASQPVPSNDTLPFMSTVLNTATGEAAKPDSDPDDAEQEAQEHCNRPEEQEQCDREEATSPDLSKSGDEMSISARFTEAPRRKRSATYDNDRRKLFENRQERVEKQSTSDRLLIYGVRSRRTRVSVKDQINKLENKERSDNTKTNSGPLGVRNNKSTSTVAASVNKAESKGTMSDAQGTTSDNQHDDNANASTTFDCVDGKENVNGNMEPSELSHVKSHEPLSRLCIPDENSGKHFFQPPKSPVPKYKTKEEKFCALKMDISLESPRTPSSESSDADSDNCNVAMATRLPMWRGRGLTPRDSSQEPEFV